MAATTFKATLHKRITCPEITQWMRLVETGKVAVCEEQILLTKHVRRVFANEKLYINRQQLDDYMRFQELHPFDLFPWEKFCLALWLCVYKEDGNLRWPELFLLLGRGAGKNGFDAYAAFCLLSKANGINNYDVDICANTEDQAKTSFKDVWNVLETNYSNMRRSFTWTKTYIESKSTKSILKYRTDNPKSKDGLRSGCVIFDEVHGYEDAENINVFTTGLGKTQHPRILYSTTDGDVRGGVLDDLKKRAEKTLKGEIPDNGFLPFICRLDSQNEVHDEKNWEKANPSLRYLPSLMDEIRREYANYMINPIANHAFMTKRMNLPVGRKDLEVTSWENILLTNRDVPSLDGLPCVCGIDFARTTDFISAVLLFRVDGVYYAKHHSWWCTNSADAGLVKAPIKEWAERGIVTMVDEVEVSPELVINWVRDHTRKYDLKKIAIDDYRNTMLRRYLGEIGYSCEAKTVYRVRPSDIMRVQPLINSAFVTGSIAWGDDPAMRWFTRNTKLEVAQNNNYKYGKIEHHSRKTDGFMAFVNAMCIEGDIPEYVAPVFMPVLTF